MGELKGRILMVLLAISIISIILDTSIFTDIGAIAGGSGAAVAMIFDLIMETVQLFVAIGIALLTLSGACLTNPSSIAGFIIIFVAGVIDIFINLISILPFGVIIVKVLSVVLEIIQIGVSWSLGYLATTSGCKMIPLKRGVLIH